MSEESPFFTLEFPSDAEPLFFRSRDDFSTWLERENEQWQWLWRDNAYAHQMNCMNRLRSMLAQPSTSMPELRSQAMQTFDPRQDNSIFRSDSEKGVRILAMREQLGDEVARIGFEIERNRFHFGQTSDARTIRRAVAAASFDSEEQSELGQRMSAERKNYRQAITRLENRVRELEAEKLRNDDVSRYRRRRHMRKLFGIGRAHLKKTEIEARSKLDSALSDFAETEDTYRNQMALLAPVQYWNDKARGHGKWEVGYAISCAIYFIIAGFLIEKFATLAVDFLKDERDASAYIIVAGALLGGTTLVFWVGRILVKLFLSEHHLRSDSKEKAIMTQSFLSMAKEGDFTSDHRAIVLASIFRSSPDGIVKEEGPADVGLHALLAKIISRP